MSSSHPLISSHLLASPRISAHLPVFAAYLLFYTRRDARALAEVAALRAAFPRGRDEPVDLERIRSASPLKARMTEDAEEDDEEVAEAAAGSAEADERRRVGEWVAKAGWAARDWFFDRVYR